MAKKAEVRLSVRLRNQRALTGTAYETGTKRDATSGRERAGAVELMSPEPAGFVFMNAIVRAESWRERRARSMFEASPGFC